MKRKLFYLAISLSPLFLSCSKDKINDTPPAQTMNITLRINEHFEQDLGTFGREENAGIVLQAQHASVSILNRTDDGRIIYSYTPESNFRGSDQVEIAINKGSDGANPGTVSYLIIRFVVTDEQLFGKQ